MIPLSRRLFMGGTLAVLAAGSPAGRVLAAASSELRIGTKLELNTLDPHFFNGFPQASSHSLIYDALLLLNDKLAPEPALATSWKNIDDLTWEFELRQNVKFHDGTPFTAEDVVATFERVPKVPNSPNPFTQFTRTIVKTEIVDPHRIRLHTDAPNPTLHMDMARVFIVPKKFATASTEDFNSGKAAVGTGPYKLVEWVNSDHLVVARNDGYWGPKQPWSKVTEKVIKSDAGRIAALLAGDVDAIDEIPAVDVPRIRDDKRFHVVTGPAATIHYLAMDAVREKSPFISAKDGQPPLKGNPLSDPRVRKALSLSINRKLIVDRLLDGLATPASQFLPPMFEGTSTKLKIDPFDMKKAKALLTEAGYGNGFKITLHSTADRYPKDRDIAQAIAQSWTRLGIEVEVQAMPGTVFFAQASKQEYSAFLAQYGTEEALIGPRVLVHTTGGIYGTANRTRFSDPELDAKIEKAQTEMNPVKRKQYVQEAIEASMDKQAIIPILHPSWLMASKTGIVITSRPDRRFNALMMKPAKA